jgi:hypothetical protein
VITCLLDRFRLNLVLEVCQSVLLFGARHEVIWDVLRLLMMDSKSVRNMLSCLPKWSWEIVHLVGFYYKNISRCTVLWMSNYKTTFKLFFIMSYEWNINTVFKNNSLFFRKHFWVFNICLSNLIQCCYMYSTMHLNQMHSDAFCWTCISSCLIHRK